MSICYLAPYAIPAATLGQENPCLTLKTSAISMRIWRQLPLCPNG